MSEPRTRFTSRVRPGTLRHPDGTPVNRMWSYSTAGFDGGYVKFTDLATAQAYWDWKHEWEMLYDAELEHRE